jgi:hypothetical protein
MLAWSEGCPSHAYVHEFAEGRRQAAADRSAQICAAHLTKQHGDEITPTAESLGRSLSLMMPHSASASRTIDQGQDLCITPGHGCHRLVGNTAWQRRRWVWTPHPSYAQAREILRTYLDKSVVLTLFTLKESASAMGMTVLPGAIKPKTSNSRSDGLV